MSKLFVITFKRPALDLEKAIYGENFTHAYDCEAVSIPEVADIRLKEAEKKYEDVEMFECEEYEYLEFVKNEDAYVHFTKTGEHSMKSLEEDIEVDMNATTETINIEVKMFRESEHYSFDFVTHIDEIGQIVLTPTETSTRFIDITRVNSDNGKSSIIDGVKTFTITLTANMLSENNNYKYFVDIDEVGQAIITPEDESTSFLTVSVEDSLNLATPVSEDLEVGTEEYETRKETVIAVIADLQTALEHAIKKAKRVEADFQAIGIHNADIDGYMIRYLEKFIDDREGEVSCAEFLRRIEEYEGNDVNESVEENKINKLDIINKFMRGDLPLYSDDGEPDPRLIRLNELDTNDKVKHEYYYDPESESVIYYEGR